MVLHGFVRYTKQQVDRHISCFVGFATYVVFSQERITENPRAEGSSPPPTTINMTAGQTCATSGLLCVLGSPSTAGQAHGKRTGCLSLPSAVSPAPPHVLSRTSGLCGRYFNCSKQVAKVGSPVRMAASMPFIHSIGGSFPLPEEKSRSFSSRSSISRVNVKSESTASGSLL